MPYFDYSPSYNERKNELNSRDELVVPFGNDSIFVKHNSKDKILRLVSLRLQYCIILQGDSSTHWTLFFHGRYQSIWIQISG